MVQAENVNLPLILAAGIVAMLLLAIAIVLFFMVYQERLLSQQSEILQLEFDHQKDLLNSSIQTQEAERHRIATDLHDSVGSMLSATKMYLAKLQYEAEVPKMEYLRKEALFLIEETISSIRTITNDLLPQSLERFGLLAATEDLVDRLNELTDLKIDLQLCDDFRFNPKKEVALYRILQELLNNTIKHAAARSIHIQFDLKEEQLHCFYSDDGKGFDWNQRKDNGASLSGLGLKNIESRVNFLDGNLQIHSATGEGIQVAIAVDVAIL